MDGALFGAFGSGGACLAISTWLVVGHRGRGKLAAHHEDHHTAYWAIGLGMLSAGAGQAFSAPGKVGEAITHAVTSQSGAFGDVGVGAAAAVLTIVLFGTKPRPIMDIIFGSALPSVYAAAGGLWALPLTVVGSVIKGLVP
jgi:hypothetical protein